MSSAADLSTARSHEIGTYDVDDVEAARASGELAGSDPACDGSENPYDHDAFVLRRAWFGGFGSSRARLWKREREQGR